MSQVEEPTLPVAIPNEEPTLDVNGTTANGTTESSETAKDLVRASKLEYKTVNQMYENCQSCTHLILHD